MDFIGAPPSLHQRSDKTASVARVSVAKEPLPGDKLSVVWNDEWPVFDVAGSHEIPFLLHALELRKELRSEGEHWVVTVEGITRLDPSSPDGILGTCFVAMSFHPEITAAFDRGMKPVIQTDCGLKALRVDRVEHNNQVTDEILAGVRSAQVLVADFTKQRQGVYFEAGYALGLGRVVIWTCHEAEREMLHFDTRQYNHIFWHTPADLRTRLAARIKATASVPVRLT